MYFRAFSETSGISYFPTFPKADYTSQPLHFRDFSMRDSSLPPRPKAFVPNALLRLRAQKPTDVTQPVNPAWPTDAAQPANPAPPADVPRPAGRERLA